MFYTISAKLAKQVISQAEGFTGWLVLNHRGEIIYSGMRQGEANEACERLNKAAR
jgi:hypothetical protein